jgi:RNA polymerase sigma-70 factor (ECF subfamily)
MMKSQAGIILGKHARRNGNAMNPQEEEQALIKRAKVDPEAFGELYECYVERIYNYIYFRIGNVHDAEDLTGKVFFTALEAFGNYHDMGLPFSAWLYRIAHNQVANYHRDRSRKREISIDDMMVADLPARSRSPEATAIRRQQEEALRTILADLTPLKQEVILLKFVDKLSNAEIAAVLNKSEGAIKSIYHRTLLELRDRLDAHDFT